MSKTKKNTSKVKLYDFNSIILGDNYDSFTNIILDKILDDIKTNEIIYSNYYVSDEEMEKLNEENFFMYRKVEVVINDDNYIMSYGNLFTLLKMAKPFNQLGIPFPNEFIFDPSDTSSYDNYFTMLLDKYITDKRINIKQCIADIISELTIFTTDFNYHYGITISLKSMIDLCNNIPEINDFINFTIPLDKIAEINEIEKQLRSMLNDFINKLKNTNSLYRYILGFGACVNIKQFAQVFNIVGYKPDLNGNIIPRAVNTNFSKGLTLRDFFINATGARKALIVNFEQVKNSGYFTRKLSMLMIDTKLSHSENCNNLADNYISINVKSQEVLNKYEKRYYYDEKSKKLKLIDINDSSLIGTIIKVPSPITCADTEGVCRKCYGELYDTNIDLNIGIIAVLILTDPMTSKLLSAKHHLEAVSSKMEWSDNFKKYLNINRNKIYINNEFLKKGIISIPEESFNDEDEDTFISTFNKFYFDNGKTKDEIHSNIGLILNDIYMEDINNYYNADEQTYNLPLNELESDDYFAYFIMENKELVQPLFKIKTLVDTNGFIKEHTVNELVNYFLDLIIEAGINIQAVHIELIIRSMLKLMNKDRTIFMEQNVLDDLEFNRVVDAVLNCNSLIRSILFEQVNRQLISTEYRTFDKDGESLLDELLS